MLRMPSWRSTFGQHRESGGGLSTFPKTNSITTRARAPLRLGLAGGGSDLSPYCDEFGGAVLNTTIDRFAYAFISPRDDGRLVFCAKDLAREEVLSAEPLLPEATLQLHRGVYERMVRDYNKGQPIAATITTTVDAPMGSGLGSSSALTVALVDAFRACLGLPLGQYDVAHLAFEIERIDLGLAGGKQDQYAAAFGGTNFIEFLANDRVIVNPLRISEDARNEFESSLVICFSGSSRDSAEIIEQQTTRLADHSAPTIEATDQLKADAIAMKRALLEGDIRAMARILDDSWAAKKRTAKSVSNEHIDRLCSVAFTNGALAGKISGAGGGGFLMFIVAPEDRLALITGLNQAGGGAGPVKLTDRGCATWQVRR
jgi:D-glycero-alpha-D-manno-heptose-7-phosphate kinase